jgi:hypothetical protein
MPDWRERTMRLKFQFGDWTLASVPLRVHMRSVQLADRMAPVANPVAPGTPSIGGASGYMLRAVPVCGDLPAIAFDADFIRYVMLQYKHCYIDLSIGVEGYRRNFSAKTRSTISRKIRKFQEHCDGQLRWSVYKRPEEMPDFHRLARSVSVKTYQERLLDAGIPEGSEFVEQLVRQARDDKVRAYILFDGVRPVSYLYCPVRGNTLMYAYLGYDPEYAKLSVGTVLQWLALEQLFEERRFEFFDFTEGQSEHKRLFATHEVECANVLFLKRSPWHAALIRLHASSDKLSAMLGRLAEHWGLKSRLRRVLRFGWAGSK